MEEAYRAWHKTLCLRSRDPDPAHPLLNLVSRVRTYFAGMVATQEQGHIMIQHETGCASVPGASRLQIKVVMQI